MPNQDWHGSGRVNAVIVGAQKCATTSLFYALARSPEIAGSQLKETNYFSKTKDWKTGLDGYHTLFDRQKPVLLEASPSYTSVPNFNHAIWHDMAEYNSDMRLIYIVRPPIDRLRSAYRHAFERGATEANFETYALTDPRALTRSHYAFQIKPFIETFGRKQVLLLRFEDVVGQQAAVLRQVARFLGVDAGFVDNLEAMHLNDGERGRFHRRFDRPNLALRALGRVAPTAATWWKRRHSPRLKGPVIIPDALRARLIEHLGPDIAEFERISGWHLDSWRR